MKGLCFLVFAIAAVGFAQPAKAIDCKKDWEDHLNQCAIVLANDANKEMRQAFAFVEKCYVAFHNDDSYRRTENVPGWWPGDGRTPLEHLQAAQATWEAYRADECRARAVGWQGSHFKFESNFCLLVETEERVRRLHSTAKECRVISMTGRDIDPAFPHYSTAYEFVTEARN